ncbi:MAG: hypothetical protein K2Y37_00195 [Pirellulales bacterium]|nr:hypothetical protein [Pirellulales bacterium]
MLQTSGTLVRRRFGSLLVVGLLAAGAAAWAQEDSAKTKAKSDEKPAAERRHRLPAHFADVITEEQREAIYKLQDEHAPEIEAQEAKLAALRKKLDDAVRGVLKPDQLKKIDELTAAAAKRRAARRPAADADAAGDAPARPRRRAR